MDFPPSQSWLTFDAPGLPKQPSKAQEGIQNGGKDNVRRFSYIYASGGGNSFATVLVFTVNADSTYFVAQPKFDTIAPSFFQKKPITWDDAEQRKADAPVGSTGYRRFSVLGRSCVSFGGLFGVSSTAPFASGTMASGSQQMIGYYCAPAGHRLSVADVELVLSRLGYRELGEPQGPAPTGFAADAQPAEVAASTASAAVPASAPAASTPASSTPAASADAIVHRSVAVIWEGHDGPITATVAFDPKVATSRLEILLPGEPKACFGLATTGSDNMGSWTVQCPSGASASGSYRLLGRKKGSMGEGQDNKGAKVSFVVAGE